MSKANQTVKSAKALKAKCLSVCDQLLKMAEEQAEEKRKLRDMPKTKAPIKEVFWNCGKAHPCVSDGCRVVVVAGPKETWDRLENRLTIASELTWMNLMSMALDVSQNKAASRQLYRLPGILKARLAQIIK